MANILMEIYSWISFVPKLTIKNLLEIMIIAVLVYEMLVWIKNTRAWSLLKGFIVIAGFILVAAFFEMNTILWIVENAFGVAKQSLRSHSKLSLISSLRH